jgi:hypothetical protein
MSLLLNLYSRDAGIILGLPITPYPIGLTMVPVTTTTLAGYQYGSRFRTSLTRAQARSGRWSPVYSVSTSYTPAYISLGTMAFMSPGGPMFRGSMI